MLVLKILRKQRYSYKQPTIYTTDVCEEIGEAVCVSLLDYYGINPISRIPLSSYKSLDGIKLDITVKRRLKSKHPLTVKTEVKASKSPNKKIMHLNEIQISPNFKSLKAKKSDSSTKVTKATDYKEKSPNPNERRGRNSSVGAYSTQRKRCIKVA